MKRPSRFLVVPALPIALSLGLASACDKSSGNKGDGNSTQSDSADSSKSDKGSDTSAQDSKQDSGSTQNSEGNGSQSGNDSQDSAGDSTASSDSKNSDSGDTQDQSSNGDSNSDSTGDSTGDTTTTTDDNGSDGGDETTPIVKVMPPSFDPPGGLKPEQVPQFIVFGFDDNRFTDGMQWVVDTFEKRKNPAGKGNPKTYDGQSAKVTFYFTTDSLEMGEAGLEAQWRRVQENRYEISNHTHTHRAYEDTMPWSWTDELGHSNQVLADFFDITPNDILGVRAPFLNHDAALIDYVSMPEGLMYDCSVTHTPSGDNHEDWKFKRHIWPYTLDEGFYFNTSFVDYGKHPGIWEMPVYTMPRGATKPDRYDTDVSGKFLAGFDSTAYGTVKMSANDWLNSMKWALEFSMESGSNRAPITIGVHSDTYSEKNKSYDDVATLAERRKAITDFLDYAETFPEVRIVSAKQVMQWMSDPQPL